MDGFAKKQNKIKTHQSCSCLIDCKIKKKGRGRRKMRVSQSVSCGELGTTCAGNQERRQQEEHTHREREITTAGADNKVPHKQTEKRF